MRFNPELAKQPVRTVLEDGQSYVDSPVYGEVPVYCGKEPMTGKALRYFKRTPLRWMKPDGKGGLVPR